MRGYRKENLWEDAEEYKSKNQNLNLKKKPNKQTLKPPQLPIPLKVIFLSPRIFYILYCKSHIR